MIKSELIAKIAQKLTDLSERDITLCINHLIIRMSDTLVNGERIEIRDFGSFSLHHRPPRLAHNPKTGKKLITQPKRAVHFKPGKGIKERINASQHIPIKKAKDEIEPED